jgi:ankyrin repeat protein
MNNVIKFNLFESTKSLIYNDDIINGMFNNNEIYGILYVLKNGILDPKFKIHNNEIIYQILLYFQDENITNTFILIEILHYLIDNGADFNIQDDDGYTLMMILYEQDHYDEMFYLIDKGADLTLTCEDGNDLFDMMIDYQDHKLIDKIKNKYPEQYKKYLINKKSKKFNL